MMRQHATWWALVVLVLALAGAAHADPVKVGSLDDDYTAELSVWTADSGRVGVCVTADGANHITLLSSAQARQLATLMEGAWARRQRVADDVMHGTIVGATGRVHVAIMTRGGAPRVSVAVNDDDDGLGCSFWSEAGQVRYLAATLRMAAR